MAGMEDTATVTREETEVKKPSKYKVILLNDDYTPMEFVIMILAEIFHKSQQQAYDIMLNVHNNGRGVAGIYSKEIAEQKAAETIKLARSEGHPLKAVVERE